MTNQSTRLYRLYLALALAASVAVTILRTIALFRHYDPSHGYFGSGKTPLAAASLSIVCALLFLSAIFVLGRKLDLRESELHLPSAFGASFAAFLLIAFAFFHLIEMVRVLRAPGEAPIRPVLTSLLASIASLVGAVSFIMTAAGERGVSARRAVSSCCVTVFCLSYTLYLYFETALPLNADVKIDAELALLASALFFLFEARIALGRTMWATRTALGLSALVLTAGASIPNIIYYIRRHTPVLETPIHDFLLLAFFLYIFVRLISVKSCGETAPEGLLGEVMAGDPFREGEHSRQISFFEEEARTQEASRSLTNDDEVFSEGAAEGADEAVATDAETLFGDEDALFAEEDEDGGEDEEGEYAPVKLAEPMPTDLLTEADAGDDNNAAPLDLFAPADETESGDGNA